MAYPSLIQKIMALRKELREANEENTLLCAALAALSEAATRMSGRIAELELERLRQASASRTFPGGWPALSRLTRSGPDPRLSWPARACA